MPDAPRMSDELRPCDCEDWRVNLPILNAPLMLMHARNPSTTPGYTGKQFVFCPWCGLSRRAVPSGGVPDSERERLATIVREAHAPTCLSFTHWHTYPCPHDSEQVGRENFSTTKYPCACLPLRGACSCAHDAEVVTAIASRCGAPRPRKGA